MELGERWAIYKHWIWVKVEVTVAGKRQNADVGGKQKVGGNSGEVVPFQVQLYESR